VIALLLAAQTVRLAVPYLLAAAGGVISERAGVVALGLEGFLLAGAFGTAAGGIVTGSSALAVACGVLAGAAVALLLALAVLRFRADQVVAGIALNLLVFGLTRYLLQLLWGSSSSSPRVPAAGAGALLLAGVLAIPFAAFLLDRTPLGLRLRAVGELPGAAEAAGIRPERVRLAAILLSGALAGLGGAYLALDQHQFTDGMSAGRGFIALAAIISGGWRPLRAGAACLLFAAAEMLQLHLQGSGILPTQLVQAIPYVLTLLALAGGLARSTAPAALNRT
jgi:ABC-type uncharacterized transport system permease subunit